MSHKKKKISLVMVSVSLAQEEVGKGTREKERLGRGAEDGAGKRYEDR